MRCVLACVLLTLLSTMPLAAQQDTVPAPPAERSFAKPFWGGVIGSTVGGLAGFAIGDQMHDCDRPREYFDNDDFCEVGAWLIGTAAGTAVGATVGAYVGGRLTGGDPSPVASAVGSLLGMGAGVLTAIGAAALFGETDAGGVAAAISFTLTHGGVTALFTSRSMQTPEEWR